MLAHAGVPEFIFGVLVAKPTVTLNAVDGARHIAGALAGRTALAHAVSPGFLVRIVSRFQVHPRPHACRIPVT
jgi:hypothetical protein